MNKVFFVISILFSIEAQAEYRLFQDKPLFEAPIANPRSTNSGMVINTSIYKNTRIVYLEGTIGREIPIITWDFQTLQLQFGLEASTWATLAYPINGFTFPLLTQDFHFGFPLAFRYGNWSGNIKFNHISAHKGDGFDILLEETLTQEEQREFEAAEALGESVGFDVSLVEPLPYSRDYITLSLGHEHNIDLVAVRLYVHLGYIHKIHPEELERWFFGNGIEAKIDLVFITPFLAQDITWNADTNSVDASIKCGTYFAYDEKNLLNLGLTINIFVGHDRRGQLLNRKRMKEFGIGFFIR